jgi:hypothetical protein
MRILRKLVPYIWGAVALAVLQLGWVVFTRHEADRRMERASEDRVARASRPWQAPGGTELRIPWFYANRGEIVRGEQAVICYGVENAESVQLEPPVEKLAPAFNRCFAITPQHTTTYTLSAAGAGGKTAQVSLTVQVTPPPPSILFVSLSDKEIRRGQPWTLCYGVRHATAAMLEPLRMKLTPVESRCVRLYPVRTTDFTLLALDDQGRTDRERFSLTVR